MRHLIDHVIDQDLEPLDLGNESPFCEAHEEARTPTRAELLAVEAPDSLEVPIAMTDDHAFSILEIIKEREAARVR